MTISAIELTSSDHTDAPIVSGAPSVALPDEATIANQALTYFTGVTDTVAVGAPYTMTSDCITYTFVVNFPLMGGIGLFGLIGNMLSCVILWQNIRSNSTALILFALALVDTAVIVLWFFLKSLPALLAFAGSDDFIAYTFPRIHASLWPIGRSVHMMGSWFVFLVTAHRYFAVCLPYKAKVLSSIKWARIQVAVIVVASIIFNFPAYSSRYVGWVGEKYASLESNNTFGYKYGYEVIMYYIVIYAVPLGSLIYFSICLSRGLQAARRKRVEMTKSKRDENDITKTLLVVVLVFMTCQLTTPIRRVWAGNLTKQEQGCGSAYFYYNVLGQLAVVFNSSANFVIYCLFGRRFRRSFVSRILRRGQVAPTDTSTYAGKSRRANRTTQERTGQQENPM